MQKTQTTIILSFLLLLTTLSGCEVIGGIFKAGVWTGFIIVALIIVAIIYFLSKSKK